MRLLGWPFDGDSTLTYHNLPHKTSTTYLKPGCATARMNWVARERGQREVNGDPKNAHPPRNVCLDNTSKKNLDASGKRPRLSFTNRAMNWGCQRMRINAK